MEKLKQSWGNKGQVLQQYAALKNDPLTIEKQSLRQLKRAGTSPAHKENLINQSKFILEKMYDSKFEEEMIAIAKESD